MRTRAQAPQRRKNNLNRALPLVAEAGKILMDLRDKPTRMDWLATAVRTIALALKVHWDGDPTSVRVELAALLDDGRRVGSDEEVGESLDTLVKILQPGAIVRDDIDRVGRDPRLLRFLEECSGAGRLVLASANCTTSMIGALLRPGRFDEIETFDALDSELLVQLLGPHADVADRLQGLPVAYVREFVARLQVSDATRPSTSSKHSPSACAPQLRSDRRTRSGAAPLRIRMA